MATNNAINSPGPSALTLIQTQNVSPVAAVTFTSGINPSINNYLFLLTDINNPGGTASVLMVQISIDGGVTYITTGYSSSSGGVTAGLAVTFFNDLSTDFNNAQMVIQNLTSSSGYITMTGIDSGWDSVGMALTGGQQIGAYTVPNTSANAIQLVTDDGSVFSGEFSLYSYGF